MHLTAGYELTTSITNIFIFLISFYGFIKIKKKEKLWKLFFFLMSVDAFIGAIVHGIEMTIQMNVLLWIILSIFFTITINTLLAIFLNYKIRHILILSILLSILMIIFIYSGFNFILAFTIYVLLVLLISIYFIFKNNLKNKYYYFLAILFQLIGGVFMLTNIEFIGLDHNGIYHLFTCLTMIFFYLGIQKKE